MNEDYSRKMSSFIFRMLESSTPFPHELPKLILAHSLVLTCGSCGAWIERFPEFYGKDYGEWYCPKCHSENIKFRRGRPFSKKSKSWHVIVENFDQRFDSFVAPSLWNTVVTSPPLAEFDWEAYKQWLWDCGWAI